MDSRTHSPDARPLPDLDRELDEVAQEIDSVQDQISAIGSHLGERRGQLDRIREVATELKARRAEFDRTERALRAMACEAEGKWKQVQEELALARAEIIKRDQLLSQGGKSLEIVRSENENLKTELKREAARTKELSDWIRHYLSERSARGLQTEALRGMVQNLQQERDRARLELNEAKKRGEAEHRLRLTAEQKTAQAELQVALLEQHLAAAKAERKNDVELRQKLSETQEALSKTVEQSTRTKDHVQSWHKKAVAEVQAMMVKVRAAEQRANEAQQAAAEEIEKIRGEAEARVRRAEEQARLRIEQLNSVASDPGISVSRGARKTGPVAKVAARSEPSIHTTGLTAELGIVVDQLSAHRHAVEAEAESFGGWKEILQTRLPEQKAPVPPPFRGAPKNA